MTEQEYNAQWKKRIKQYLAGFLVVLGVYLVLIILYIYPHRPIDLVGWSILILVGIPVSIFLEWIGEIAFSKKAGLKISGEKFSTKRLLVALLFFVLLGGVLVLLWLIFGSIVRPHFL